MPFWYPVCDHPDAHGPAWFRAVPEGWVYRTAAHPIGASELPSFQVIGDLVYATEHETMPDDDGLPVYQILGSMISPADGHPAGASLVPWYQARG